MALTNIEKSFGKGAIMRLGQATRLNVDVIPTGAIALDLALGVGGIPRGRITEIYGTESSGKTTIALQIIAECQKQGGVCAFVDAEHALDPEYAANLGVDVDSLYVSQPGTGEEALEIMDYLVRPSAIDVVVPETVKIGTDAVGSRTKVKVVKNKVAPPFRQAEFDIMFGRGISKAGGILDLGVEMNLITKSGSFFSYNELRMGQGRENARMFLEE